MKSLKTSLAILLLFVLGIVVYSSLYVVHETNQVIITQFGRPVGEPKTKAGLHFKVPFIQDVNRIEKRVLAWDGYPTEMPTKDKTYIVVDTFARWRISDAKQYFLRLRDERRALSRLDDILGSETRNAIAKHELIELIRTTKDRVPTQDVILSDGAENIGILYPINKGRAKIEEEIYQKASEKLTDFGIKLLDVSFKRINYNQSVRQRIYERMISERQQIAERFRSQGAGEAAKINGRRERDLQEIESEAYKKVLEIRGQADAKASEIYAQAFNRNPETIDFYEFIKTLETYEELFNQDTTLLLSTKSDLFSLFKKIDNVAK